MQKIKKNLNLENKKDIKFHSSKLSEKEFSLERIRRKKRIMKFAGIFNGVFGNETIQSIKSKMK